MAEILGIFFQILQTIILQVVALTINKMPKTEHTFKNEKRMVFPMVKSGKNDCKAIYCCF